MEIGCHLPMFGPMATRETVLAFARRMEALGYDSLWASDHIVIPHAIASRCPYNESGQFPLPPTPRDIRGRGPPEGRLTTPAACAAGNR